MHSRLIRVLLVVFAIAIGIAAGYFLKTTDTNASRERRSADALREQVRALSSTISDVRAGQTAYVARGQGDAFWMSRVSTLLPALDQQMADFKAALRSPAALSDLEQATGAVENFHKLDARVQEYVKRADSLLASDLIFSDGLGAMSTATTQIDAALTDELAARQAGLDALRANELKILGGAAGAMLLILMLLGFTGPATAQPPEPVQQPVEPAAPVKPFVTNLGTAARLCTDLARVHEWTQLPGLLERTAKVIDASGLIVWVADAGGHNLRPAMSFGYSDQVMARMGSIPRDAANAAAAAYRSAEMRTVNSDGFTNGALVAPLLTVDGCIGVLSAEMKGGAEKDEGSQALAVIFAAQLASLVSPPPSAALNQTAAQA